MNGQFLAEAIDLINEKYITEAAYYQCSDDQCSDDGTEKTVTDHEQYETDTSVEYSVINEKKNTIKIFRSLIPAAACIAFIAVVSRFSSHPYNNKTPVVTVISEITTEVTVSQTVYESTSKVPEKNITDIIIPETELSLTEQKQNSDIVTPSSVTEMAYPKTQNNNVQTEQISHISSDTETSAFPETSISEDKHELTLDVLMKLTEKGYDLTWSDFEKYDSFDHSSDVLTEYSYEVDDGKYILVIGGKLTEKPYYIYLRKKDQGNVIDIRANSIEDFIYGVKKSRFEFKKKNDNVFTDLVYIRADDEDPSPEVHSHSFSAKGFTVEEEKELSPGIHYFKIVDDNTGQNYIMNTYIYEAFRPSYNPEYVYNLTNTEINGRAACIIDKGNDPEGVCTLYWNDGCHISTITSQLKDYETMRFIAENLATD